MPSTMLCPSCGGMIAVVPGLEGVRLNCPHCSRIIAMHSETLVIPAPPPLAPRETPTLVIRSEAPEPMPAKAWFTRGFAVAAGVLVAIFLACYVLPVSLVFLARAVGSIPEAQAADEEAQARRDVLKYLKPYLERNGVMELARDAEVDIVSHTAWVKGTGRSIDNKLLEVEARVKVLAFEGQVRPELQMLAVDGVICEGRKY